MSFRTKTLLEQSSEEELGVLGLTYILRYHQSGRSKGGIS